MHVLDVHIHMHTHAHTHTRAHTQIELNLVRLPVCVLLVYGEWRFFVDLHPCVWQVHVKKTEKCRKKEVNRVRWPYLHVKMRICMHIMYVRALCITPFSCMEWQRWFAAYISKFPVHKSLQIIGRSPQMPWSCIDRSNCATSHTELVCVDILQIRKRAKRNRDKKIRQSDLCCLFAWCALTHDVSDLSTHDESHEWIG